MTKFALPFGWRDSGSRQLSNEMLFLAGSGLKASSPGVITLSTHFASLISQTYILLFKYMMGAGDNCVIGSREELCETLRRIVLALYRIWRLFYGHYVLPSIFRIQKTTICICRPGTGWYCVGIVCDLRPPPTRLARWSANRGSLRFSGLTPTGYLSKSFRVGPSGRNFLNREFHSEEVSLVTWWYRPSAITKQPHTSITLWVA